VSRPSTAARSSIQSPEEPIEGAITQAIGGALFEAIQFGNVRSSMPNFRNIACRASAIRRVIRSHTRHRKDIPSAGAGETPMSASHPPGNAIFNATGVRLRSLPLVSKE